MHVRPLEPSDQDACAALVSRAHPTRRAVGAWGGVQPDAVQRMGAFDARGAVHGVFELEPSPVFRMRHSATLRLWGDAAAVLPTALVASDRWMGIQRLMVTTDAADPELPAVLEAHGFAVEARQRLRIARDGALHDTLSWARQRPGWVPDPPQPPPAWAERRADGDVVIRPTVVADAEPFARIFQDPAVAWGVLQLPTTSGGIWAGRLAQNPAMRVFSLVAEAGGELVGSAGAHPGSGPHAHVAGLGMCVARAWQGRGVGRRLFQAVVDHALAEGYRRLELEVYTDNVPARALYEGFGFEPEGVRKANAWRDGGFADSLVMGLIK